MRFGRGANVHFHLACASVRKHLLLEARQSCRDNSTRLNSVLLLDGKSYGRGTGVGRGLTVGAILGVGLGVKVGVAIAVAVGVAVGVCVAVAVAVGVAVGVCVAVAVAVGVGVGDPCAQVKISIERSGVIPSLAYPPESQMRFVPLVSVGKLRRGVVNGRSVDQVLVPGL